jgi:hypothetical protein
MSWMILEFQKKGVKPSFWGTVDNLQKLFVIYPGRHRYPLHEKIEAIPLPDFLTDVTKGVRKF